MPCERLLKADAAMTRPRTQGLRLSVAGEVERVQHPSPPKQRSLDFRCSMNTDRLELRIATSESDPIQTFAPVLRCSTTQLQRFGCTVRSFIRRGADLVRLDVGCADHLCPLFGFFGDQLLEVGGRAWAHHVAHVGKPSLYPGEAAT